MNVEKFRTLLKPELIPELFGHFDIIDPTGDDNLDIGRALSLLSCIAYMIALSESEGPDGHITIFRFSTHWKVMLGTPDLDSGAGRNEVLNLPHGNTLQRAIENYLAYLSQQADESENKIDYYKYIQSPEWKQKATEVKERAGWKCQLCNKEGSNGDLHAHHNNYKNLGNETEQDIIVLCAACHKKFHNK